MNPPPKKGNAPATWDLVLADMRERDATGAAKYGVRHQHDNGRNHLQDAYEEALDLAVYLRAETERRKTVDVEQVLAESDRLRGLVLRVEWRGKSPNGLWDCCQWCSAMSPIHNQNNKHDAECPAFAANGVLR